MNPTQPTAQQEQTIEGKRVLCNGCNKPIHIDHLAGVAGVDGKEEFFCDALPCLLRLNQVLKGKEEL